MKEIRARAREVMAGSCRVCPVCDGKACAGEVPGMGGLGTGSSFQANVKALAGRRLNMRTIHDVVAPDPGVTLWGRAFDLPVLAAPVAGMPFNMGGRVPEPDYVLSVLAGCVQAGTLGGTGDGAPPFLHEAALAAIKTLDGAGIPFFKPWEGEELERRLALAAEAGATIAGIDVDAAGLVTLRQMGRPVSPKPVEKLRRIVDIAGMKFILKGIMTAADARLAVEAGADGLVVSNHGGRVLDHTPGTAEVLPEVAAAVKGRIVILADGGVRSGVDVLKMLALGADAVMIGRPVAVAALGGGREGVAAYFQQIKSELVSAMILTGCAGATSADRSLLFD
ncbi:MAG: alpha-hydroxy-acid oxidizing protein [Thermodesulfobacteriota bacterium]